MVEKTKREEIIELVNRLFVYTDEQDWKRLTGEVFTPMVVFDMSSLGGQPPAKIASTTIAENWKQGFGGLDHVYHQSGNFIVKFTEEGQAQVSCYAIAVHHRKLAKLGSTREFFGTYDIMCVLTDIGWRINGLRYNSKFIRGNQNLE